MPFNKMTEDQRTELTELVGDIDHAAREAASLARNWQEAGPTWFETEPMAVAREDVGAALDSLAWAREAYASKIRVALLDDDRLG